MRVTMHAGLRGAYSPTVLARIGGASPWADSFRRVWASPLLCGTRLEFLPVHHWRDWHLGSSPTTRVSLLPVRGRPDRITRLLSSAATLAPTTMTALLPLFAASAAAYAWPLGLHGPRGRCVVMSESSFAERQIGELGIMAPKLTVRPLTNEDRGKGGVVAAEPIAPMEVIARIPRSLIIQAGEQVDAKVPSWAADLTAASLAAPSGPLASDAAWAIDWASGGGWGTDKHDLGADGVRWGSMDVVGTLMATGSDNDKNIYAKFRFPCHPVAHRAGLGLSQLVGVPEMAARNALLLRSQAFRDMRDALIPLVEAPTGRWARGSMRDQKAWDVADTLSKVLSRATTVQLDPADGAAPTHAIVPLHERLFHCDARGENAKLVGHDPRCSPTTDGAPPDEVLLLATRGIEPGEEITRDYTTAPRLEGDGSDGALRLLLQFGLPPAAWPDRN